MIKGNVTNEPLQQYEDQDSNLSVLTCIFISMFILMVTLMSAIGNVFTCLIVYRKRTMRSAINLLLTNIALADILLAIIVMPYILCEILNVKTSVFAACVSMSVLKDISMCSASYTLLIISIDRYLIIVHRMDRLRPKLAKVAIVVIWCCSTIVAAPQLLSFVRTDLRTYDKLICTTEDEPDYNNYKSAYKLLLLSLIFYGPVAIMSYTYAAILRTVQQTSKRVHDYSGSAIRVSVTQYSSKLGLPPIAVPYRFTGDFNAKRRAFGTIMMLFITLVCCWLPYTSYRMVNSRSTNLKVQFSLLGIGFVKSALYPVIFSVRNKRFRVACMRYIPTTSLIKSPIVCLCRKQRRINPKSLYQCPEFESRI